MSVEDVFRRVKAALDAVGIPYMITGSYASSIHGEPRASKDIDVVIEADPELLRRFVKEFPSDQYYAVEEDALEALANRRMFNVIDFKTGWRIDFIFRKERAFSHAEFARRREQDVGDGLRLFVASPEDILLAKLEWAKLGESARQLEDATSIVRMKRDSLDISYIERWVAELQLEEQWSAAIQAGGLTSRSPHEPRLWAALQEAQPAEAVHRLAVALRDDGVSQVDLYRLYYRVIRQVDSIRDEIQFDALADTLDDIIGWCSQPLFKHYLGREEREQLERETSYPS